MFSEFLRTFEGNHGPFHGPERASEHPSGLQWPIQHGWGEFLFWFPWFQGNWSVVPSQSIFIALAVLQRGEKKIPSRLVVYIDLDILQNNSHPRCRHYQQLGRPPTHPALAWGYQFWGPGRPPHNLDQLEKASMSRESTTTLQLLNREQQYHAVSWNYEQHNFAMGDLESHDAYLSFANRGSLSWAI